VGGDIARGPGAAVFAGLVAYAVLAVELERDRLAAQERRQAGKDRRWAQALHVAAWYETWPTYGTMFGSDGPELPRHRWGAVIRNASELPLFDVCVSFCVAFDAGSGLPWQQGMRHRTDPIRLVPPGVERVEIPDRIRVDEESIEWDKTPKWLVAVEFTDASKARWLRDPLGNLGPVPNDIDRGIPGC
jgi:hypothetical protein